MTTSKKSTKKRSVKVSDLRPSKDPKAGRDSASGLPSGKRQWKPIKLS